MQMEVSIYAYGVCSWPKVSVEEVLNIAILNAPLAPKADIF